MTTEVATVNAAPTSTWEGFQREIIARKSEIASQLPSNITADRFVNAAIAAVKQNPDILKATPRSLFAAITKAAQDGLVPDGREGVITVYKTDAAWNPMAYGLRKRARELDGIIIDAQVVFEGDEFAYELGDEPRIHHKPKARSEVVDASAGVAVYAIFRHPTEGILHREVMWKPEVFATMNQSRAKTSLMWTTFWTEGWRKAVVRRGMKSVPVSPKLEQVIARVDDDFEFDAVPAKQIARPTPPTPPAEDDSPEIAPEISGASDDIPNAEETQQVASPETSHEIIEPVGEQHVEEGEVPAPTPPTPPADEKTVAMSDADRFLAQIEQTLKTAQTLDELRELWVDLGAADAFKDDERSWQEAQMIFADYEARINRRQAAAEGQGDLLT